MEKPRLWSMLFCLFVLAGLACRQRENDGGRGSATQTTAPTVATATTSPDGPPCAPNQSCKNSPGSQCLSAINANAARIPANTCSNAEGGTAVQESVDIFAWNEFVALNWPANPAYCTADESRTIADVKSGDGTFVVWQTYMPGEDVFVAAGRQPAPWCGGNGLQQGENRLISAIAKAHPVAIGFDPSFANIAEPEEDVQASGPRAILVDQRGRWVRYERLMNRVEYDFIVDKKLYLASTLRQLAKKNESITLPPGTIEIKAAWKVLTATELQSGRFFTTRARVNNTPGGTTIDACDRAPVWLGLVGLHIVHKTPSADSMIWSTFEHVDTDRIFYDEKKGGSVRDNQLPPRPLDGRYRELSAPPECKPLLPPTQAKRLRRPEANPKLNQYYQNLLKGSVFQHYRLIGSTFVPGGSVANAPEQVANLTMETYAQIRTSHAFGQKWTGCFGCHIDAATKFALANGQPQRTNLSFFFLEAK